LITDVLPAVAMQVATIWNEVLCQQAAAQGDAAAMQRLSNFNLRHTAAGSNLSSAALVGAGAKAAAGGAAGAERKPAGVSQATAIFKSEGGPIPSEQSMTLWCMSNRLCHPFAANWCLVFFLH
jgi:hypothetical protein